MIPFWGKLFIEYLLDRVSEVADEAIIVVPPDDRIRNALGDAYESLPLRYVTQQQPRGTGDAVLQARGLIEGPFLLLLGDTCPARKTIRELSEASGDATVTLIEVDDPHNHLGVSLNGDGVVAACWTDSRLVDAGVVRMTPPVLDALSTLPPRGRELRMMQGVEAVLKNGGEVRAVKMPGPWLQFGDHEELPGVLRVMRQLRAVDGDPLRDGEASVGVPHANCTIHNSLVFGPGELIDCEIRDSMVYCEGRIEGRSARDEMIDWVAEA